MTDLERAIAVIADLCGAGRPAVKETKEELAEWAEEFVDRYFDRGDGFFALRIPLANTTIALEEIKLLLTYAPTKKPEQGDYDSSNHGDSFDYGWAFAMWGVRQAIEKALSATSDISK